MNDYDMTTMRIASSSVFFRRLTYALFIGWVVYGVSKPPLSTPSAVDKPSCGLAKN
jgi:hypothetical protein